MHVNRRSLSTKLVIAFAVVMGSTVGVGGCAVEPGDEDESFEDVSPDDLDDDDETTATTSSELGGCNQCTNCVKYARCRQPRLPYGLTYWKDKLRIINTQTPRAGCVAVIKTGSAYGHVAYVRRVNGSTIHIDEGNWGRKCNSRSGTKAALKIQGYWCR